MYMVLYRYESGKGTKTMKFSNEQDYQQSLNHMKETQLSGLVDLVGIRDGVIEQIKLERKISPVICRINYERYRG
jgi:hypothetical protein